MSNAPALSEEEIVQLRAYIKLNQPGRWRRWWNFALFAMLPLASFALGQWLLRWVPGHLAARGLALCQSHQTLRKGVVWWPTEMMDLTGLLKGPAGALMLCAFLLGMMVLTVWVQESQARKVATILTRLHPELMV